MERHIRTMTSAQTRRVQRRAAELVREWLTQQGASPAGPARIVGLADLERDVYVAIVERAYVTPGGRTVDAELTFELDHRFESAGAPTQRPRAG